MNSDDVTRVAAAIGAARQRDQWTARQLASWRQDSARRAAGWAREHSAYYAESFRRWDGKRLETLPVLTRSDYLERWDDIVTDKRLTRQRVGAFLATAPSPVELLFGRYHIQSTSGTSGAAAPFAHSTDEWVNVCAGVGRLAAWRGSAFGTPPKRYAIISLNEGFHMGARITAGSGKFFESVLQIDAAAPTAAQAAALNGFQPEAISAYPTAMASLAEEQQAGRLNIRPKQIVCSSEMLSPALAARIADVFGVEPHNTYSATEFGFGAATCHLKRMHLLEDLALFESVDEDNRPAPPGEPGAKTLVTVFWAQTLPLIRYELGDRLIVDPEPCTCGLPYATISGIEGRRTDVLHYRTLGGEEAAMSARQIEAMLAGLPIVRWQIARGGGCAILRVQRRSGAASALLAAMRERLIGYGIGENSLALEVCDHIAASRSGKTPLFVEAA